MQIKAAGGFVILTIVILASPLSAASVTDFIDFSLRAADNSVLLPGRLHVPAGDPSTPRPLVLFLHGGGEFGTDNLAQINVNIDNLLAEMKLRNAFLYAPQNNFSPNVLANTMLMIDRAIADHHVDRNRIYVTGLSFGGGETWNIISQYPDRFAAAVPICPVGPSPLLAANLVGQPIWDFHARNDGSVPVGESRKVISSILSAAAEPLPAYPPLSGFPGDFQYDNSTLDLHYTEPLRGGHSIWHDVYKRTAMYNWMFAHAIVPEPSSLVLIGMAIAALGMCRCLSRRKGDK